MNGSDGPIFGIAMLVGILVAVGIGLTLALLARAIF